MPSRRGALILALALALGPAYGGNLGNVTSLRLLKGQDGKPYIEIGHSASELQAAANTDFKGAGTTEAAPVLIPWPAEEAAAMATWSILQKALVCQCIRFVALSGSLLPKEAIAKAAAPSVLVSEYRFLNQ